MIINLDAQIRGAKDIEDIKIILSQMQAALNQLSDSKNTVRQDVKFLDDETGPVLKASDNSYWRLKVTGTSNADVALDFVQVGTDV